MTHTECINKLIKMNAYKTYVEIGVGNPFENFIQITCDKKIGVDPYFDNLDVLMQDEHAFNEINNSVKCKVTSDEFFDLLSKNDKFDVIFINGLHKEYQVDKDIQNALEHLTDNGVVIVHDTNPLSAEMAFEDFREIGKPWVGTVYKSISKLSNLGMHYFTLEDDWGITAIKKPSNFVKAQNINASTLTYEKFNNDKKNILNIVDETTFFNKLCNKVKTLLCCIVKQENLYLRDFVEYYKNIGFTNIVLYDNNDKNGEYPQQVIGDYIANGFVIYENVRGKYRCQLEVYTECFKKYSSEYNWIAFFDVDEYLSIQDGRKIDEYLSDNMYNNADAIYFYWLIYGDNGLLHYDNRPVYNRFLIPNKIRKDKIVYKVILHCSKRLDIEFIDANSFKWHATQGSFVAKNTDGEDITNKNPYEAFSFNNAVLKHYVTLTVEEFLYRRFGRRSYADKASSFNKETILSIFTDVNEMTKEKEKVINEFFDKFEIKEDNI